MSKGKILFQLSGSIACFKAAAVISKLVQDGFELETVATRGALEFIGRATIEGLTGRPVHTDVFQAGAYMDHIRLAKWADVTILCPASANSIAKLANGIADDLVSTLFLAHDLQRPYIIAPAMNAVMFDHPATRKNLQTLREMGVRVLESGQGHLACGDVGSGRLLESEEILQTLRAAFAENHKARRILITAGGTQEAIDGVRSITNQSTGRTGAALADVLIRKGYDVSLVHAENSIRPSSKSDRLKLRSFTDFKSLEHILKDELKSTSFDAVVHAAAVSDYSVSEIESEGRSWPATSKGKISSSGAVTIRLSQNPKIIDSLRSFSRNPLTKVVAFKLTNTHDMTEQKAAIASLASHAHPDLIVHNDLNEIAGPRHPFSIWRTTNGKVAAQPKHLANGAFELAEQLDLFFSGDFEGQGASV